MWKILLVNIVLLLKATGETQQNRQWTKLRTQATPQSLILRQSLGLFWDICEALMLAVRAGAEHYNTTLRGMVYSPHQLPYTAVP